MNEENEMESIEESLNIGLDNIYPQPTSYKFYSKDLSQTPVREKILNQIDLKNLPVEGTDTNERGKKKFTYF
jgi:hypothetical protein